MQKVYISHRTVLLVGTLTSTVFQHHHTTLRFPSFRNSSRKETHPLVQFCFMMGGSPRTFQLPRQSGGGQGQESGAMPQSMSAVDNVRRISMESTCLHILLIPERLQALLMPDDVWDKLLPTWED